MGSSGEAELQWGHLKPAENTGQATMVRDLCKSGCIPSGHDTESDFVHNYHSNRRRHRKHRLVKAISPIIFLKNHRLLYHFTIYDFLLKYK